MSKTLKALFVICSVFVLIGSGFTYAWSPASVTLELHRSYNSTWSNNYFHTGKANVFVENTGHVLPVSYSVTKSNGRVVAKGSVAPHSSTSFKVRSFDDRDLTLKLNCSKALGCSAKGSMSEF